MSGAVVLVGLSGSGKSTVGRLVAQRLAVPFVDTDDLVATRAGKPVHRIFAEDGEEAFRDLETEVISAVIRPAGACVVATGGGAVLRPANRAALTAGNTVVWLDAPPETLAARLHDHAASPEERPLLRSDDLVARLAEMVAARGPYYSACATLRLDTAGKHPHRIADEIVVAQRTGLPEQADVGDSLPLRVTVPAEQTSYPIVIGWGVLGGLRRALREAGLADSRPLLFMDAGVVPLYGEQVRAALSPENPADVHLYVVPAGEQHKTLAEVERAYTWLARQRAERGDIIIVVGGGKAGDLAGFVAATYLRGLRFVQVPTTLLAQVDSSLGGKVGVDLPAGKNLVGAFHHPSLVVADLEFLRSLPRAELAAGYAEVVKSALIGDPVLFGVLEEAGVALLDLPPALTEQVVRGAMAVKVAVVQDDVREAGQRAILNYGHSVGHALEVVTGYRVLLHGQAVAFGMVAAAELSRRLVGLDPALARRQNALLHSLGLLGPPPAVAVDEVVAALGYDKKVQAGRLRWVLLRALGDPQVTADVPPDLARQVIQKLLEGALT